MLPNYQYTEYISPMGNTQIYIIRKRQRPFWQRFLKSRRYALARQKMLGVALVFLGVGSAFLFKEDASAPMMMIVIGMLRVICK